MGGLFFMAFSIFIALVSLVLIEDLPPYELTLTADGCAYAQSINLPIEKKSGQCSVVTRVAPHVVGSSGELYLDNGKTISIAETMLLSTAKSDTKLQLTPRQLELWKWVYVWLTVAMIAGGATIIYWKLKK